MNVARQFELPEVREGRSSAPLRSPSARSAAWSCEGVTQACGWSVNVMMRGDNRLLCVITIAKPICLSP
jgi:hypothetical protein